ncbi:MAG TPA: FIST N-terminal domain-containing protein [Longimicrobiales bacterium]|nr:FIST N-terminal domain-containing protein [Longimicrobiales bacterium]
MSTHPPVPRTTSRTGTRVGVGWSENANSRQAGAEAASAALQRAGLSRCTLALIFATSKHDPVAFHAGARSVLGSGARVVGGYSVGIITNDFLGYEGYQCGVAVFDLPTDCFELFIEHGLDGGEHAVGVRLGEQIRQARFTGDPSLIVLYDAVREKTATAMSLNMATPLLEGMTESLETWPAVAGVGMFGDLQVNPTYQWFDDAMHQQAAMTLALHNGVRMHTTIMHGCKPSSTYHTITKADGPVVLEIDGKPALQAVADMLGPGADRGWEEYPLFVTLGVNKGEKFGEFREDHYANRMCMAVDQERQALVMFEPDLKEGDEVQLMRRSLDFDYVRRRTQDMLDSLEDREPFFALYIDCAGRAAPYCGTEEEEAAEVQKAIGDIPLLGMYSGVEIAKVAGQVQALDWTGVLCVFTK